MIADLNNIQKGNYGEMKMDVFYDELGYNRISVDRVTDLNTPTHQGIDGCISILMDILHI